MSDDLASLIVGSVWVLSFFAIARVTLRVPKVKRAKGECPECGCLGYQRALCDGPMNLYPHECPKCFGTAIDLSDREAVRASVGKAKCFPEKYSEQDKAYLFGPYNK